MARARRQERNTTAGRSDAAQYVFRAKLWLYEGPGAWHFLTLPVKLAAEIEAFHNHQKRDFGSIRVGAVIGSTRWQTSLFRDNRRQSFLLPVKTEIRRKEKLVAGSQIEVTLEL